MKSKVQVVWEPSGTWTGRTRFGPGEDTCQALSSGYGPAGVIWHLSCCSVVSDVSYCYSGSPGKTAPVKEGLQHGQWRPCRLLLCWPGRERHISPHPPGLLYSVLPLPPEAEAQAEAEACQKVSRPNNMPPTRKLRRCHTELWRQNGGTGHELCPQPR